MEKTEIGTTLVDPPKSKSAYAVSVSTLLIIGVSLLVGVIATLIVQNQNASETVTFSTVDLLSFMFGIALSAASMVLAIAAISLGKESEQAMIRRSDESIRIQNEVFAKTIDALARIESSTGVTEKRIEDMISGRAGAISESIVSSVLAEKSMHPKSRQELEQEIRKSVLAELQPTSSTAANQREADREKRKKEQEVKRKRYKDYKDSILLAVANLDGVQAIKIGDGGFEEMGSDLVDGLFKFHNTLFSISTLTAASDWLASENIGEMHSYIRNLAAELAKGTFVTCFLVFDRDFDGELGFNVLLEDLKLISKENLVSRIVVLSGSRSYVIPLLEQKLHTILNHSA